MDKLFVNVALPVPVNKLFTYSVPSELKKDVAVGKRVLVPFGRKEMTGFIVGVSTEAGWHKLKNIKDVLDPEPVFTDELMKLTRWVADYYFSSWGEVLKTALPQGTVVESKRIVKLVKCENIDEVVNKISKTAPKRAEVLRFLSHHPSGVSINKIKTELKIRNIYSILNNLEKLGFVKMENLIPSGKAGIKKEKFVSLSDELRASEKKLYSAIDEVEKYAPRQLDILMFLVGETRRGKTEVPVSEVLKRTGAQLSSIKSLVEKGFVKMIEKEVIRKFEYEFSEPDKKITLNKFQLEAVKKINQAVDEGKFKAFLLYGVTGSGKTQVYIEAIKKVVQSGKTAIVLVPEISLTPQMVDRFKKVFGDVVGVLHSKMSAGERYDTWRLARYGSFRIIIGPRSAVFAPLENLGLIVVDEEQESSYKQFDSSPRYNARDVAVMRARINNAIAILGSATPSLESYYNAKSGKYELLELPERVDKAKLPRIEIVNMIKERKEAGNKTSISNVLKAKIKERLDKGEGIIIFQNRRGYSTYIECQDCGFVESCSNCSVTLTFHLAQKHLRCHYCGKTKEVPDRCARCGGIKLKLKGVGTQKVETELKALFPEVRILRMDLDTTVGKKSHDKIITKFLNGEADILVGTQMVAKGLDFSRVTLVGVISADIPMLIPDFRSAERTFQLLTQVAGRSGRSEKEGEVIIQTFNPEHYIMELVAKHRVFEFYEKELEFRKELGYPPFSRLVLIEFKGPDEKAVSSVAEAFSTEMKNEIERNIPGVELLGPAPAAIPKIKRNFRYHIILKTPKEYGKKSEKLHIAIWKLKEKYEPKLNSKGIKLIVDVDPQNTI